MVHNKHLLSGDYMMDIDKILKLDRIVISVVGPHAGENYGAIIKRKRKEISDTKYCFWYINSYVARPDTIQNFFNGINDSYCLFIESVGKKDENTITRDTAREYSIDGKNWEKIPPTVKVTGLLNKGATALIIDELESLDAKINFNIKEYYNYLNSEKDKQLILQGKSTVCCKKKECKENRSRKILAIGHLIKPYGVWVK